MDAQAGQNSVVRGAIELGIMMLKANPIKFMWELEERHKGGNSNIKSGWNYNQGGAVQVNTGYDYWHRTNVINVSPSR